MSCFRLGDYELTRLAITQDPPCAFIPSDCVTLQPLCIATRLGESRQYDPRYSRPYLIRRNVWTTHHDSYIATSHSYRVTLAMREAINLGRLFF